MSFIQNLYTSRDNNANAQTYVGQQDRLWWDPVTNAFYASNGNTPGGVPVGTASPNALPSGPINSLQFNAGSGNFGGSSNLTFDGSNLVVTATTSFLGNVISTGTRINNGNFIANGTSVFNGPILSFGDSTFNGNVTTNGILTVNGPSDLANLTAGRLTFENQVISGTNINGNITFVPEGSGVVVVPALGMNNTLLYTDAGGYNIATTSGNISINSQTGVMFTNSSLLPTMPDVDELGTETNYWNSIYAGTGGLNIRDTVEDTTVNLVAANGNLVIANAGGLTVADFTFYNNAITIGNLAQDITIGTIGATGKVVFNRSIEVRDSANTRNVFSAATNGFVAINANNIPTGTAGALNIVGSSSGNYQPVNGAGGMIHITGNDNTLARITVDGYATSNTGPQPAQAGYGLIALRASRGTADNPHYVLQNDILASFSGLGMTGTVSNGVPSYSTGQVAGLQFFAAEDFVTNTSGKGTYAQFKLTPVGGSAGVVAAQLDTDGITLPVAGSGITFNDNSFQTTAFNPANVVTKITVGTGLTQDVQQGNVAINATGVQNVVGTSNQVIVSDSGGKNLTLSLPQSIATSSTLTFGNLTITGNLNVQGTTTTANSATIVDKALYLANTSTSNTQIDGGGLYLGNNIGGYQRSFLYNLSNDRWDTDGAGLQTLSLVAQQANVETLFANGVAHFGTAFEGINYPNGAIQVDSNVNSYSQVISINHSSGTDASTDFVATNNIGNDTSNFIDLGINSSTYSNVDYSLYAANAGYLFINGGDLNLGTQTAGNVIVFHTGGTTSDKLRATISDTGLSVVGNIAANNISASTLTLTGNINAPFTNAVLTTSSQPNVTSVGILISLSVTGNVNGGNLRTAGQVSAAGNVTGGNILTNGLISTTGNITGGNINSINGTFSSSISATGNITGANLIATAGTFASSISATGNITGGNITTAGQVSSTGNVAGGNITTAGQVSSTGNVNGGNLRTGGIVIATGNVTGGNITTAGQISSTGNVNGGNILTAGIVSSTGNVTGGNILTAGIVSSTGNIYGGNVLFAGGVVSGTGNVAAGNIAITNIATTKIQQYTPYNIGDANLTIAVDFTNGSVQYANLISTSNPTVTLSNLLPGQQLTLIITNTSGTNRNITHGCSAANSTAGTTSQAVNNNRIGIFKYYSVDTTAANCRVGFE